VRGGTYVLQNYGSATVMEVKDGSNDVYDRRTFLRFNLAAATGATSATLKVYVDALPNGSPVPVCASFVATDTWKESSINWSNQPAAGAKLACQTISATGWVAFDITGTVQQQIAGDKLVTVMLTDSTVANRMAEFRSRENASNKPVLEIR